MEPDLRKPLRWAVLYRAFAAGALCLGLILVAIGVVVGFGTAVTSLVADPLTPGPAIDRANPLVTLAFAMVGLVVWQVGKTLALFVTLPRAAGRSAARQFDSSRLRSEVLEGLDDRLAELQADVEETRRSVRELKRAEYADHFDERDHLEADDGARSTADAGGDAGSDTRQTASTTGASGRGSPSANDSQQRSPPPGSDDPDRESDTTDDDPLA